MWYPSNYDGSRTPGTKKLENRTKSQLDTAEKRLIRGFARGSAPAGYGQASAPPRLPAVTGSAIIGPDASTMSIEIICSACGRRFPVTAERLGRNVSCAACGHRTTARPAAVTESLRRRARLSVRPRDAPERLPLAALLDDVRSLWNVGSIFRTADAFGFAELALCGITGCPPRAAITKTALGADEAVAWSYDPDPLAALERLARSGYTPVALEATSRAVELHRASWPARPCLVVGNEVAGVSSAVLAACEHHVRIPMRGIKESLNVAVAFGVAAWHAAEAASRTRAEAPLEVVR
jgi:tRNA G18 (ribose-2'-O)-methylase SpoU